VVAATHGEKFRSATCSRLLQRDELDRTLFAEDIISSDIAMMEQGAVRRQCAPFPQGGNEKRDTGVSRVAKNTGGDACLIETWLFRTLNRIAKNKNGRD
jgi:hypothetical protein